MKTNFGRLIFSALIALVSPMSLGVQISAVNLQVDETVNRARIEDLLDMRVGSEFSRSAFSKGMTRIAATGLFKRIEGSFDTATGSIVLEIEPLDRISEIEVVIAPDEKTDRRVRDMIAIDIEQILPVRAGSSIETESVTSLRQKVEGRLKDRGFHNSRVVVALQEEKRAFNKKVLVSIELGARKYFDGFDLLDFDVNDIKLLRKELAGFDGFEKIFPEFRVPETLIDYPEEFLLKNRSLEKKISKRAQFQSKSKFPMDWISLNQGLAAWSAKTRSAGYYEFRQSVEVVTNGESTYLRMYLKRGPKYRVEMKGNTFFWERELRTQILEKTIRLGIPLNLQDAQTQIQNRYRAAGFAEVQVEYEVAQSKNNLVATFQIVEGRRYFLSDIKWDGLTADEIELVQPLVDRWKTEISPVTRIYYSEEAVPVWIDQLSSILRDNGYLAHRFLGHRAIKKKDSPVVELELSAQLGTRYRVRDIVVTGRPLIEAREIKKAITVRRGEWANLGKIMRSSDRLRDAHQARGFVSCEVSKTPEELLKYSDISDEVDVYFTVDPGPGVRVGKVLVDGLSRTQEEVVLREFSSRDFEQGAVWNPEAEREAEGSLLGLGIFSSVKRDSIGGKLLSRADETGSPVDVIERDLKVSVAERPAGSLEFGPGYRTNLGVVAFAELNYRNLWGMNRSIFTRAQVSRRIAEDQYLFPEQKYSISLLEPYVLNTPLRFRILSQYSKEDNRVFGDDGAIKGFAQKEFSLKFLLEKDFGWIRVSQGLYSLDFPEIFAKVSEDNVTRRYRIASIDTFLSSDSRDNVFNPTRGVYWSSNFEYAAPDLGSGEDVHYYSVASQFSAYYTPIRHVTFVGWISGAHISSMGSVDSIPESKRLFVGGLGSVRSLPEKFLRNDQEIVGRQESLEMKAEYRQAFLGDLSIALFFDAGQLWAKDWGNTGFRKGTGVGLRFSTPVGPLALDLAVNLDRRGEEDASRVLFSVGNL